MLNDSDSILPLLALKEKLERAIQGYLDRVAALRKRLQAVDNAVDMLRSSDDDILLEAPRNIRAVNSSEGKPRKKRIVNFDVAAVEAAIKRYLAEAGPLSKAQIMGLLVKADLKFSARGLREILTTNPDITRVGERESSRYALKQPTSNSAGG